MFAVLGANGVLHGCAVSLTYQGDGTASEPAARHTRAQRPGRTAGRDTRKHTTFEHMYSIVGFSGVRTVMWRLIHGGVQGVLSGWVSLDRVAARS